MTHDILGPITRVIVGFMSSAGYGGLAVLMAMESACLPVPSEIVLPFTGFLVAQGRLNLWLAATVAALGCNFGSLIAYEIVRRGGRRAVQRWGRYVLLTQNDLDCAERLFARFGGVAVLAGRMLPVVRTYIALPAGIAAMPRLRFHVYTFVGSWPWCLMLVYVGVRLGDRWSSDPRLHTILRRFDLAMAALVTVAVAVFVVRRIRLSRCQAPDRRSTGDPESPPQRVGKS